MREPKDYIVFPLDLPTYDLAMKYVDKLASHVGLFKIGLELFISQGPMIVRKVNDAGGAGVFLDLKLHDIPATVARAFQAACSHDPEFVTVHCDGGRDMLLQAAGQDRGRTKILAVTVLTSHDSESLSLLGYGREYAMDIDRLVLMRARMAKEAGCDGVICSGKEVANIKGNLGKEFIAMTPGIRPRWSLSEKDDQKRVVTPDVAVRDGADYIVIGRPIRDASDPADAAKMVAEEIASAI
jgi:orotidine-5'-phosphate decarboxylase